jgi:uncharacterized sulfatase
MPERFRASGYFTASISKVFHVSQWDARIPENKPGSWKLDDVRSWDFRINTKPSKRGTQGERKHLSGGPAVKDPLNYRLLAEGDEDDQDDGQAVRDAIGILEEKRDKPFFLCVGFRRPHAAWIAPKKYFDQYPLSSLKLPDPGSRDGVPQLAFTNPMPNYGVPQEMLEMLQGYYASVSFMDAQFGRLLAAINRLGLQENTIIVFIGDNGFHLGEHGLWHKNTVFEESARVPFFIRMPGATGNGRASTRIVEMVDLFPTLADLCGVPAPAGLQGTSLRPLLQDPAAPHERPAFTQVLREGKTMGRSVRTARWRYTEWDDGRAGTELYDHDADPGERINLSKEDRFKSTIAALSGLLRQVRESCATTR